MGIPKSLPKISVTSPVQMGLPKAYDQAQEAFKKMQTAKKQVVTSIKFAGYALRSPVGQWLEISLRKSDGSPIAVWMRRVRIFYFKINVVYEK